MPGPMSDGDRDFLVSMSINLGQTEEGHRLSFGLGLPFRRFIPPAGGQISDEEGSAAAPGERILRRPGGPSRRELTALNLASMMTDWIGAIPTDDLEERYRVFYGGLVKTGEQFAWLLQALASVARVLGRPEREVKALGDLARRAAHGVPAEGLPLARLRVSTLGRGAIAKLLRAGFATPRAIADLGRAELSSIIGQDLAARLESAAQRALELERKRTAAARPESANGSASEAPLEAAPESESRNAPLAIEPSFIPDSPLPLPPESGEPAPAEVSAALAEFDSSAEEVGAIATHRTTHLIEINLQSPGIVRARGGEVFLPPLSFELLAALAERPGEVVTRAALYHRLWPDGGPEDQQLDGHRRNLLRRLRPMLGHNTDRIAEVVRGIGFRLALPASSVELRRA